MCVCMCLCACVVGWQEGSGWWWAFDTWHRFLKPQRVGCSCGWMCGTKTESVSVTVCGCETARKKGILKDSHRNVSVSSGYVTISSVAIFITPHCVRISLSTHLPLSAHSERCVWLERWLRQVGFLFSSTYVPDPGSEVSSVRLSLLPAPPPASVSFSIYWLIRTWDFLYRRRRCPGSCGWVCYRHYPRTDHSPPAISSLHPYASRKRKKNTHA